MSEQVFEKYAEYYNILYKDKDYVGETNFIHRLIQNVHSEAKSILNLGCGTGNHDFELAKLGYEVTGVDLSDEMLANANSRLESMVGNNPRPSFYKGDIRDVRLGKKFDVVISLFHVMSYQSTNDDVKAAFVTAKEHLTPGGHFIFDCWYGPAVLSDPPVVRIKRLEDETVDFVRIAEPVMYPNENLVDVNYQIILTDRLTGTVKQLRETHRMRYFFTPEIELFLRDTGLRIMTVSEWMTGNSLNLSSWGACFVVEG